MGDVLDPKPPQWQHVQSENDKDQRVALLATRLLDVLNTEVDSTLVQLAALRLLQETVVGLYIRAMGVENGKELVRQAIDLAKQYEALGIAKTETDGPPEEA